ncbi:hypothetical protein [Ruminococcus sp.]|uniref:hypothetical protein n=1 Tax=Ruminococcus sp. TaxID=41978 RepID=UPI0025EA22DD|nr:hypothetical protein [Ruminococcus sp.]MBR1431512.1 hypothetical protein [Ruminococcus sp.]
MRAIAYSKAERNYSVVESLVKEGQVPDSIPADFDISQARYFIVDVSDPDYFGEDVPLDRVAEILDHHTGFEALWRDRIGSGAKSL